jgi:hypothetical protein
MKNKRTFKKYGILVNRDQILHIEYQIRNGIWNITYNISHVKYQISKIKYQEKVSGMMYDISNMKCPLRSMR